MWTDCPSGKHAHATREDAQQHVAQMRRAGRARRGASSELNAYRCGQCDYWHVGHQLGRGQQKKALR